MSDVVECPRCGRENQEPMFRHWGCAWCGFTGWYDLDLGVQGSLLIAEPDTEVWNEYMEKKQ